MKSTYFIFFGLFTLLYFRQPLYGQDVTISKVISSQLGNKNERSKLHFPKSVKRLYALNGLQLTWLTKQREKQTFEAMMLLDCVLHYGLAHGDYHPDFLVYDNLQQMINTSGSINTADKVRFDIRLTDAIITLISNLHYGKLNPQLTVKRVDGIDKIKGFDIVTQLRTALNSANFTMNLEAMQPKSKAYHDLQGYMRLIKGQYVGDCYQVPESSVRKVAINMERLRWWENNGHNSSSVKGIYLTCVIKDGLPVFYPDTRYLDPSLEAAMYNKAKPAKALPKKAIRLPNIQLKTN
jgi:murein L,D-transpeptidase YcbB/YkuD